MLMLIYNILIELSNKRVLWAQGEHCRVVSR